MSQRVNLLEAFRHNILMLKIIGAWSFADEFWYKIYKYFVTYGVLLNYLSLLAYLIIHHEDSEVVESLYTLPAITHAYIKFLMFRKNFRQIKETLDILQVEACQPRNETQKKILNDSISFAHFFLKCYTGLVVFLCGTYIERALSHGGKSLPTLGWIPFDYQQPVVYELIFTCQSACFFYWSYMNVSTDCFICISMLQIGSQCDLISDTLRNIHEISTEFKNDDFTMRKILIECVSHYNLTLRYANLLADAYKEIVTVQFADPASLQFFQLFFYQSAVTCEIFFYCFFGNRIIEKIQKPIVFYAWNIFPINADTFKGKRY
ncbi:7tm 6 domain containing protein [Asbolus verrucosus]|uniref:7tm 6 domain containing protein n=1 Tax=Asbolus verrucosus TaxID=1661398 RepID=A0A482W476_ASBVE|nr:7tm 6 domain containing protein [Asbolus verrucosus]